MSRNRMLIVVGTLLAPAIVLVTAGCGGGAAAPAVPASSVSASGAVATAAVVALPNPTTIRKLESLLVTTAELPDGIKALEAGPAAFADASKTGSGPPCENLEVGSMYMAYNGLPPVRAADVTLHKQFDDRLTDPTGGGWEGSEDIAVYRDGQAGQFMTNLGRLAGQCIATPLREDTGAGVLIVQIRPSNLTGMGDQALDVHVTITSKDPGRPLASDWIAIRSGRTILVIWQLGGPATWNVYTMDAARAAWAAFKKGDN